LNNEKLWTIRELAEFLGIKKSSAYAWLSQGRLESCVIRLSARCVRFDPALVRKFVEAARAHGTGKSNQEAHHESTTLRQEIDSDSRYRGRTPVFKREKLGDSNIARPEEDLGEVER
jgi:predicted DNA-binding transcriptional regulator AlpA